MKLRRKYSPYLFIALLSLLGAGASSLLVPDLPWYLYVVGGLGRFIFISAIWQLIALINKRLEKRFSISEYPTTQILLQVLVTTALVSPVFVLSYLGIRHLLPRYLVLDRIQIVLGAIFFLIILLLTFGYYSYDLFLKYQVASEEKTKLQLEAVRLEKEKSMMRYHHLKNQVNPHFLFNALTSLDGLILSQPSLASEFIRHLSTVYRYVLEHKENEVVGMETELAFIRHYVSLLRIRYQGAVEFDTSISESALERGIVTVTLQLLIDNAIKHNATLINTPLKIRVWDEGDFLHVQNNKQLRKQIEGPGRQGLWHLKELYGFLTNRPVEIHDKDSSFEVTIPLL